MHVEDVWAGDASEQPAFEDEPLAQVGVVSMVLRQHLHRDGRVEPLVAGPVDGGETTGAEQRLDAVGADALGQRRATPPRGWCHDLVLCSADDSMDAAIARPRAMRVRTVLSLTPRRSETCS